MRNRDSKGRFIKKSDSEKSDTKTKGKYKDNKGRWHGSNGKYIYKKYLKIFSFLHKNIFFSNIY